MGNTKGKLQQQMIEQRSIISGKQANSVSSNNEWSSVETSSHFDDFFLNQIATTDWDKLIIRISDEGEKLQKLQISLGCKRLLDIEEFKSFTQQLREKVLKTCLDDFGYALIVAFDRWKTTDFQCIKVKEKQAS